MARTVFLTCGEAMAAALSLPLPASHMPACKKRHEAHQLAR